MEGEFLTNINVSGEDWEQDVPFIVRYNAEKTSDGWEIYLEDVESSIDNLTELIVQKIRSSWVIFEEIQDDAEIQEQNMDLQNVDDQVKQYKERR